MDVIYKGFLDQFIYTFFSKILSYNKSLYHEIPKFMVIYGHKHLVMSHVFHFPFLEPLMQSRTKFEHVVVFSL